MTGTLPQWCADIISSPPRSGEGFHNWLFRAAHGLWKCGRRENDICEFLQNAAVSCGRHVAEREILDAVRHSTDQRVSTKQSEHTLDTFTRGMAGQAVHDADDCAAMTRASDGRMSSSKYATSLSGG
jgi:hypothetical protein